jgi:abortive infection bacteriophage resistance protein
MKHLRNSGIAISGSSQKRRLKNIGYYHGYKGYRFAGTATNKLSLTDFSQVVALYDFDTQLKTLFYSRVMAIETALKNYTLEAVLNDAKSESFEDIWRMSLTDYRSYRSCSGRLYREAWERRQRLRSEIDSIIFGYRKRPVIGHFRDADKDTPIWAIFEVMTLGNFGAFYDCLDKRVKTAIVRDLGMPTNLESGLRLKDIIFALKDFRNAIAHNGVIVDVRFKSGSINTGVAQLLKQETGVGRIDFTDITDYLILLVYLMRRMGFTKTECKQLVTGYGAILEKYRAELPFRIYSKLIKTSAHGKLIALRQFVSNG